MKSLQEENGDATSSKGMTVCIAQVAGIRNAKNHLPHGSTPIFAIARFATHQSGQADGLRSYKEESAFSPIGVIGGGSIPLTIVGSIALLLILLRYVSIRLVPLANDNSDKGVSMVKTLTARTRIFLSSAFETIWAIGVSSVAGFHLLA